MTPKFVPKVFSTHFCSQGEGRFDGFPWPDESIQRFFPMALNYSVLIFSVRFIFMCIALDSFIQTHFIYFCQANSYSFSLFLLKNYLCARQTNNDPPLRKKVQMAREMHRYWFNVDVLLWSGDASHVSHTIMWSVSAIISFAHCWLDQWTSEPNWQIDAVIWYPWPLSYLICQVPQVWKWTSTKSLDLSCLCKHICSCWYFWTYKLTYAFWLSDSIIHEKILKAWMHQRPWLYQAVTSI